MIVCRLGATMGPVGLWASGWLCSKSVIAAPAATPPVSIVSLPTPLVSVTVSVFMEQGRYPCAQPQPGGPGGSLFVWSLPFDLLSMGGPTRSTRLQPT